MQRLPPAMRDAIDKARAISLLKPAGKRFIIDPEIIR